MRRFNVLIYFLFVALMFAGCGKDDDLKEENKDPIDPPIENEDENSDNGDETQNLIITNDKLLRQEGYVLVNDPGSNRVYIMDKDDASAVHEWTLPANLGNDAKLLDDGTLMVSLRAADPKLPFGGYGGRLQLMNKDSESLWDYDLSTDDLISHHDVIMLPGGNILAMLWERTRGDDAVALGYNGIHPDIYTESLVEINPETDEIVWKWDSRDHLVQDALGDQANYGVVAEHPEKIDINYKDNAIEAILDNGDLMHANGITYNKEKDLIYMSVNYYSEVWVIDHSTSVEEVAGSSGGNMGVGGDLVYRFGNPEAYDNEVGERRFYNNHTPRLLEAGDHMLIFMNGNNTDGPSKVYELDLPDVLSLNAGTDNEPTVVWEYTHAGMYSAKVSGAERLPNGNTLIAIGTYGYWEVTPDKEVVWQFKSDGFYWRGYHIDTDDPVLGILGVE